MIKSKKSKSRAQRRARRSASLSIKGKNSIDRMASERLLSRGETIFRKGQTAQEIYKVEIGCIKTFAHHRNGRRLIVGLYFSGDYFGLEMSKTHHVSAESVTPSKILVIGRKALISRAAIDVAVANELLDITNRELHRALQHSRLLRIISAERVGQFLLDMKKRNRSKEVDLMMSRQDIADYLNLAAETVARALTQLENVSAISFRTHRRIAIHMRRSMAA